MNGPSPLNHIGNGEPAVEKDDVAKEKLEDLLTSIKNRPAHKRGLLARNIKEASHGIDVPPIATTVMRPPTSGNTTKGGVKKPTSITPKTHRGIHYVEVDPPELTRNKDGDWVLKES